ncbi:kinesin [Thraustotheca clavata]|uniref:Kinesin n=1 Tax=Thraustotheca clavata TaxID=74557 RepID=A0A1W0A0J5_9STRA|nr:kinesin [Thraustotheca clavata]
MGDNVQVAVRVRPFNEREKSMNSTSCIRMVKETQQTIITDPDTNIEKSFTFDFSYDSFSPPTDPCHASQDVVWNDLGIKVLEHAWTGFNVSLFAYGQTGAGKSFSMVGYGFDKGIIPRASRVIFERITSNTCGDITYKVEASMMEIYNEKVKDLFNPSSDNLRVRDHPSQGPYADGLTRSAVSTYEEITALMDAGIMARTTASTNMNATSSRAHTIFQILLTQSEIDQSTHKMTDKVSRINLIDLAGSERAASTGATGARLKEGAAINQVGSYDRYECNGMDGKSLSALGNCISALADNASGKKKTLVPYRNSKLTHLLKDSLGGNAKTIMIAALSPASVNFAETLSTLRYADRAKQIKNQAIVNEDPNQLLIRKLKDELEQLRKAMIESGGLDSARPTSRMSTRGGMDGESGLERPESRQASREEQNEETIRKEQELAAIREQLEENQRLLRESEKSWTDRLKETEELAKKREEQLKSVGLATNLNDIRKKAKTEPHLINLNEDQQMSEKLFYFINPGINKVGRTDAEEPQSIILGGLGILKQHCTIESGEENLTISIQPGANVFLNGEPVKEGEVKPLSHNDRIILGNANVLRVVVPSQLPPEGEPEVIYDWQFAMKELNCKQMDLKEDKNQTDKELADMESRIKEMEDRMKEEREAAELKVQRQKEEWDSHVKKMQEDMKVQEMNLKLQLQQTEEGGNVDKKKLAEQLAEQETKLAEEMAKAEVAYEKKQLELIEKQKALELSLQKQMLETKHLAEKKEREQQERAILAQELLHTIPLVKEANMISEELKKNVGFTVKLLPTKPDLKFVTEKHLNIADTIATEMKIQVTFQDAGTYRTVLWDIEKFNNMIYEMRELYQIFIEKGRQHDAVHISEGGIDPFYEAPSPQLIGRSYIYLSSMVYGLKIADVVPILDSKGAICGKMTCEITPTVLTHAWQEQQRNLIAASGELIPLPTLRSFLNSNLRVHFTVTSLTGIPGKLCRDVFVAYKWYGDDQNHVSEITTTPSVDPVINFVECIECPISEQLIACFESTPVEISVFGNVPSSSLKTLPHEVLTHDEKKSKSFHADETKEDTPSIEVLLDNLHTSQIRLEMQEKVLMDNSIEIEHHQSEVDALQKNLHKIEAERDELLDLVAKLQKTNRNLKDQLGARVLESNTATPSSSSYNIKPELTTTSCQTDIDNGNQSDVSKPAKEHRKRKKKLKASFEESTSSEKVPLDDSPAEHSEIELTNSEPVTENIPSENELNNPNASQVEATSVESEPFETKSIEDKPKNMIPFANKSTAKVYAVNETSTIEPPPTKLSIAPTTTEPQVPYSTLSTKAPIIAQENPTIPMDTTAACKKAKDKGKCIIS